jgi:hypothetical protein
LTLALGSGCGALVCVAAPFAGGLESVAFGSTFVAAAIGACAVGAEDLPLEDSLLEDSPLAGLPLLEFAFADEVPGGCAPLPS